MCIATLASTVLTALLAWAAPAQAPGAPWQADRSDGTYRNPILYADYSDPDAIRVGDDFYMIASSFTAVPGLPVLHSRDLVNWTLVGHALPRLVPDATFASPQHGGGVWAPALRHHAGRFWIYYPDPDRGIYLTTAANPRGPWTPPVLVKEGKGLIDPCPLWDDDGRVYLVHAWARSRAGFANVLTLLELNAAGARPLDQGHVVIDGDTIPGYTTLEGPKLYKRDGWYYVFAPAGGVKQGWQSVFRSRSIHGPYESRIVLAQGRTDVNGPHQGALVDTQNRESWFVHFQDLDAYGRVVHLQPVSWRDGWPVIGEDRDGDGTGEPVRTFRKPEVGRTYAIATPATSDEFASPTLGMQWQWQANPAEDWISLKARRGALRLRSLPPLGTNLWAAPNLLLQKLAAPAFVATTALQLAAASDGERAGLVVFGVDYAWAGLRRDADGLRLVAAVAHAADTGRAEQDIASVPVRSGRIILRVSVSEGAVARFSYSTDNRRFTPIGEPFTAAPGRWVGAKIGIFASGPSFGRRGGHADFDWFRVTAAPRPPASRRRSAPGQRHTPAAI